MDKKNFRVTSFSYEPTPEIEAVLKTARQLAAKDGWTFSEFVRNAISEYVQRHAPGNPQVILAHWTRNQPMPETIRERKQPEPDPMEGLRSLSTDELIRQLARLERADRRSEIRTSIEMLLQWMVVK
jgi:hypothetical protein